MFPFTDKGVLGYQGRRKEFFNGGGGVVGYYTNNTFLNHQQ